MKNRIMEWTVTAERMQPKAFIRREFMTVTDAHRYAATLREGTYRNVKVGRMLSDTNARAS